MPTKRIVHPLMAELRRIRLSHNITGKSLAKCIGVCQTVHTRWEKGDVQPRLAHLIAWANALQLDLTLCPTKPSTKQPSLNETSPILHSYRALKCSTPGIVRR